MDLIPCSEEREFDRMAAEYVAGVLTLKPAAAIVWPTGNTPLGMYAQLVAQQRAGTIALGEARCFNLDDYVGVPVSHPLSYDTYLRANFLTPAGIPNRQIRLLDGNAADLALECRRYDAAIARAGGLDLAVLGLGGNGHIAFNEPGSDWRLATHVVDLSPDTRAVHREQSGGLHDIPLQGITVGIATIRAARAVLLLVSGAGKQRALDALCQGDLDARWPVTALLEHPYLTVVCAPSVRAG